MESETALRPPIISFGNSPPRMSGKYSESKISRFQFREQGRRLSTHLENVRNAILTLDNWRGSTRDEIAKYLVSQGLMEEVWSRAMVARAIYQGIDDWVIKRTRWTLRYEVCKPPQYDQRMKLIKTGPETKERSGGTEDSDGHKS